MTDIFDLAIGLLPTVICFLCCSKVGRPPSKKVTDRKTFTRPGHVSYCGTTELVGNLQRQLTKIM